MCPAECHTVALIDPCNFAFQVKKDLASDGPSSSTSATAQATEIHSDNDVDDDDEDDDLDVDELNELEASLSRASLQINEPSDTV